MRILIINFEYPPLGGGGGVATKQLAEDLVRRTHEVHVLTTQPSLRITRGVAWQMNEIAGGVHVHRVKVIGRDQLTTASIVSMLTFVPAALLRGWQLCRRYHFDVINAQFVLPSGLPAAVLARAFHLPFVLSFIGGDLYDPSKGVSPHRHWMLRAIIRWIARAATICTAISEDTKRRAEKIHGVVDREIMVTHLGLSPIKVPITSRLALGLPQDVPLFISIGRLIPRKGFEMLLKAWRKVPNAHLVIIGSGPLKSRLQQFCQQSGLMNRVSLMGFLEEEKKTQILSVADGFVSATEHEGFGIVFLEAMEAGLPIVATNRGGHTDFLTDGRNALLVPPGDADQLAAGVSRLIQDRRLREVMAANNRQKVKEFYLEKTVKRFEDVLLAAVRNHPPSPGLRRTGKLEIRN